MDLIKELEWRGMIHNIMPETKVQLEKEMTVGYVGFDPTADALHVGSLVPILLLKHLQLAGHKPIALVGGATGMIGDPSGKSKERSLLDEDTLAKNVAGIQKELSKHLDFDSGKENIAVLVNNYDWMRNFSFIEFARDIGKHISVNYMMAKESVKKRLSPESGEGMSFTEFTYQLFQGYDFLHLNQVYNCKLQMGGSDQWGNITTGTELIRRKTGSSAVAFTCPLITKADGSKFGKSESGNIWLDATKTSPFKFYQFWLNTSDSDAEKYIKIFTFLKQNEIESLIETHKEAPHLRALQTKLAEKITTFIHGESELEKAKAATKVLFGKSNAEDLKALDLETFNAVFDGVPQAEIKKERIKEGVNPFVLFGESGFLKSNSEVKRALKENSLSVNKTKIQEDFMLQESDLINETFLVIQRGKKNQFVLKFI